MRAVGLTRERPATSFRRCDEPFDLDLFFTKFLELLPAGVFRSKGLLYFKGYDKRYVFQLSGRRYRFEDDDWPEGSAPSNQVRCQAHPRAAVARENAVLILPGAVAMGLLTCTPQVVVIGRNLDVEKMKRMLKSCCVTRD